MAEEPMVTITAARLAELEAAEARLAKRNHSNIERLKAYREANPNREEAPSNERVKRWYERNREEYNAKRREKRRQAKETAAVAVGVFNHTRPVKPHVFLSPIGTLYDFAVSSVSLLFPKGGE